MKSLWILALLVSGMMAAGQGRNQPTFAFFDTNGDGKITKTEFEDGRQKRMEQKKAEGKMMRNMNQSLTFEDIDTDSDGSISPNEFMAHQSDERWGCFDNRF